MHDGRPTALVTGASSGIGLELARVFAANGYNLVLVARSADRLRELARNWQSEFGVRATVIPADLAATGAARQITMELEKLGVIVDVLVNNAGFGAGGDFDLLPIDRQIEMIQVNVVSLVELTHTLLPAIKKGRRGGILNVGSTAAFQAGPAMAVYYATKAFVLSFSEALREELRGSAIRVSCLCPGVTVTNFVENSGMGGSLLIRLGAMQATDVARIGFRGFSRGKTIVVPGWKNKWGVFLIRVIPRSIVRRVVHRLNKTKSRGNSATPGVGSEPATFR